MRQIFTGLNASCLATALTLACVLAGCSRSLKPGTPVVGFLDFVQDDTLAKARQGFIETLDEHGFSEKKGTIEFVYRCAQGDQPTLILACKDLVSRHPVLVATCPTLSTIVAAHQTPDIPILMMVSPRPDIVGLTIAGGAFQGNLLGAYETLDYLKEAPVIIHQLTPGVRRVGLVYNPAEPQSVLALKVIRKAFAEQGLILDVAPVDSPTDAVMVAQAQIARGAQAFFAMPDNTVFASFEALKKVCDEVHLPIYSSESGLVARGALAAYGADFYAWGRQVGEQAAHILEIGNASGVHLELVKVRKRVFNRQSAAFLGVQIPEGFEPISTSSPKSTRTSEVSALAYRLVSFPNHSAFPPGNRQRPFRLGEP
ncbi:MAG TPA: ABC transporter substrate-binding protein [Terriglobia bacterium]|nr:ABC transporter substrate-binding protein [Terriglobia bacterium]